MVHTHTLLDRKLSPSCCDLGTQEGRGAGWTGGGGVSGGERERETGRTCKVRRGVSSRQGKGQGLVDDELTVQWQISPAMCLPYPIYSQLAEGRHSAATPISRLNTHPRTHSDTSCHTHTLARALMHAGTELYSYTDTRMHARTHTHTHTHTRARAISLSV